MVLAFFRKVNALLRKELLETKRNVLVVLIILLLPIIFGVMLSTINEVVPISTPVLIVPANENVTKKDMVFVSSIISKISDPRVEYNKEEGIRQLLREEVYFVIEIPPDFRSGIGTVIVYVDSSMTPVSEASDYIVRSVRTEFRSWGSTIVIKLEKIGEKRHPFEYFLPGIILMLICIIGLIIIPISTTKDKRVFNRILTDTSIITMLSGKLIFALILIITQILILNGTQILLEAPAYINLLSFCVIIITTISITSIGLFVNFMTRFSDAGKYINTIFLCGIMIFSGAFYPVRFMPDLLQRVAESFPLYQSVVLIRCFTLKGVELDIVTDYLLIILGFMLISIVLMLISTKRIK